jgi:Tol biopolymer transport system component
VTRHPAEEGIGMFVWSPDSRQIAFISTRDNNEEVYVVNADGTGPRNLSRNPAMDDVPLWSPDGKKVAFVSNRSGFDEIYVMDTDGGFPVQLTFTRTREDYPRWQP